MLRFTGTLGTGVAEDTGWGWHAQGGVRLEGEMTGTVYQLVVACGMFDHLQSILCATVKRALGFLLGKCQMNVRLGGPPFERVNSCNKCVPSLALI